MDHIRKEDMAWISEVRSADDIGKTRVPFRHSIVRDELIDGQVWASEVTDLLILKGWTDTELVIEQTETKDVIN